MLYCSLRENILKIYTFIRFNTAVASLTVLLFLWYVGVTSRCLYCNAIQLLKWVWLYTYTSSMILHTWSYYETGAVSERGLNPRLTMVYTYCIMYTCSQEHRHTIKVNDLWPLASCIVVHIRSSITINIMLSKLHVYI